MITLFDISTGIACRRFRPESLDGSDITSFYDEAQSLPAAACCASHGPSAEAKTEEDHDYEQKDPNQDTMLMHIKQRVIEKLEPHPSDFQKLFPYAFAGLCVGLIFSMSRVHR